MASGINRIRLFGLAAGLLFVGLMLVRLGLLNEVVEQPKTVTAGALKGSPPRENWLAIYQRDRKIGYAHSRLSPIEDGYRLAEQVRMRINTMGMVQDLRLETSSRLHPDMSLADFEFSVSSGRFRFSARGSVNNTTLTLRTAANGREDVRTELSLRHKPYLAAAVLNAIGALDVRPGEAYAFDVFDPTTLGQRPVRVDIVGEERIRVMGTDHPATKITMQFKGARQEAWIGAGGELLLQKGLLGIRMEQTSRVEALNLAGLTASDDLTKTASVPLNRPLPNPTALQSLSVRIGGGSVEAVDLAGGRQSYADGVLSIRKESLEGLAESLAPETLGRLETVFLRPEPLIQSDHEKIRTLAEHILSPAPAADPLEKARRLIGWVQANIDKRPVVSMPDALSTLENRMGDCNEHAVLLAALARAAGIPARIETGLVYLRGRMYYHAWNLLYLGRWVTADALLGQLPADVTHIRLVTGSQQQQLDLVGIIGNVHIDVVGHD